LTLRPERLEAITKRDTANTKAAIALTQNQVPVPPPGATFFSIAQDLGRAEQICPA
jgi:hypothetical protein